jgi:hypothetical protein
MFFVDSAHVWLELDVVSSSNFRRGHLLITEDGGKTWNLSQGDPGVGGSLYFINRNDGWLAGGPGDQHLYATADGGNSWRELSLTKPHGYSDTTTYEPPFFRDDKHGFLPVTYSAGDFSTLVLFATNDGGKNWLPHRTFPSKSSQTIRSTLADSTLITATASGKRLTLTRLTPDEFTTTATADVLSLGILELSFTDADHGWAFGVQGAAAVLLATRNGGRTWSEITPHAHTKAGSDVLGGEPAGEGLPANENNFAMAGATAAAPSGTTHKSMHAMFDQCQSASQSQMQAWWTASPYFNGSQFTVLSSPGTYSYPGGISDAPRIVSCYNSIGSGCNGFVSNPITQ